MQSTLAEEITRIRHLEFFSKAQKYMSIVNF